MEEPRVVHSRLWMYDVTMVNDYGKYRGVRGRVVWLKVFQSCRILLKNAADATQLTYLIVRSG
jgi:hypothetical protein